MNSLHLFLNRRVSRRLLTRVGAILALTALAALTTGAPANASDDKRQGGPGTIIFTVDVAEDFSLFTPTFVKPSDTQPERGSFFVTEGNIFPAGTIEGDGATFDPDSAGALGRWFCRGTHLVSAAEFPTSARAVHTAQLYLLPDESRSLATDGVEGNVPVLRALSGGTGVFRGYVGEQKQEMLGFNATGGVNLRVTFILRKAVR
ncbi:MAG TPA: hypothetical protein VIX63_07960 [Vicinamibacterales bacterium]